MAIATEGDSSQALTWRGQWLGFLAIGMLVFFTWLPNSYYLMVAYPWILIWQVGFLLLAIWAIWMLRQFHLPFRLLGYGFDWVVGLTVVTLVLSGIFAQFKEVAAWNVSLALCYVILFYIIRNWVGRGNLEINFLWKGVSFVGVISCLLGLIVWWQRYTPEDPRNAWTLGQPNFMAGYILLVLPLTVALGFINKGWQRLGAIAASCLMLVVLYTTSSRGGLLGFFVLTIVSLGFLIFQSRGKWRLPIICAAVLSIIIIFSILLSNSRVQQIIQISALTNNSPALELRVDGESQDRLFMWQAALSMLHDHFLLGVGPGNMSRVYDLYRPIETGAGLIHLQELHSTPMQIIGELGLAGISLYGLLIACVGRLWFRLYKVLSAPKKRCLLFAVGGSFLAYFISSLTDYQLENIAIGSTLVILIIFLITLTDETHNSSLNFASFQQNKPNYLKLFLSKTEINESTRRWLSLGIITTCIVSLYLWLPVTWAMRLSAKAEQNILAGNITQAYEQASEAAELVPWDPTYNLLAGFQALNVRENVEDIQSFNDLTNVALEHFQKVIAATPNDATFNQSLGILYRDTKNTEKAAYYFSRAIRLYPRTPLDSYYLLGREYFRQQKIDRAITAFALQGLITPEFLTSKLWETSKLSVIKEAVARETINLLNNIKEPITTTTPGYNQIQERLVLLKWWHGLPLGNWEQVKLRPIIKALILAETSPKSALEILNKNLENKQQEIYLLRAWLDPEKYLNDYLNIAQLSTEDSQAMSKNIQSNRNLKSWLSSLSNNYSHAPKIAIILTYRNYHAKMAGYVLLPPELDRNLIVQKLNLFPHYPREFPVLDRLIHRINTKQLNLAL
jgi:O-antigen ligase